MRPEGYPHLVIYRQVAATRPEGYPHLVIYRQVAATRPESNTR